MGQDRPGADAGHSLASFETLPKPPRALPELRQYAEYWPELQRTLLIVERVQQLIDKTSRDITVSAIATFPEVDFTVARVGRVLFVASLEFLVITSVEDSGKARQHYDGLVFSPILGAFQRVHNRFIWTRSEMEQAREEGHPVWLRAQGSGITFYGEQLL